MARPEKGHDTVWREGRYSCIESVYISEKPLRIRGHFLLGNQSLHLPWLGGGTCLQGRCWTTGKPPLPAVLVQLLSLQGLLGVLQISFLLEIKNDHFYNLLLMLCILALGFNAADTL